MYVVLFHDYTALACPQQPIKRLASAVYRGEGIDPQRITNIILCSDYKIRKLNKQFRDKDRPTDVLSFAYDDDDLLGEIYISLQRVAVQARRFGLSYQQELLRLVVHGLFHLQGYTHENDKNRLLMESKERQYVPLEIE